MTDVEFEALTLLRQHGRMSLPALTARVPSSTVNQLELWGYIEIFNTGVFRTPQAILMPPGMRACVRHSLDQKIGNGAVVVEVNDTEDKIQVRIDFHVADLVIPVTTTTSHSHETTAETLTRLQKIATERITDRLMYWIY